MPCAVLEDMRVKMLGRIAKFKNVPFGAVTEELILTHHLADGAHEVHALIEGYVVTFVVLPVLAADREARVIHRSRVAHVGNAHARNEALLARNAAEGNFHFAVAEFLIVEIVPVERVALFDDKFAVLKVPAAAVGIDFPAAKPVFEGVMIEFLARLDIAHRHACDRACRAVSADEQSARIVVVHFRDVRQRIFADVCREHLLHIVVGREHNVARVEPDHVGRPAIVIRCGEERRVARHLYNVGVALAAREERRLGERRTQVVVAVETPSAVRHRVHCVLAHEHLRAVAVVAVVTLRIVDEPLIGIVDVLVHDHIAVFLVDDLPVIVGILRTDIHARRRNDGNIEEFQKVGELALVDILPHAEKAGSEVIEILVAPVFVADAEVFEIERRGVTHIGAHFRPIRFLGIARRDVALCKVDEVRDVIDHLALKRGRAGHNALITRLALLAHADLTEHAAVKDGQRSRVDVLAEAEILIESDAVGLHITPDVGDLLALFERTYRVAPFILIVEPDITLDDAAAGETQERGVAVFEHLHHAGRKFSVSVLVRVAPRRRGEQGNVVDTDLTVALEDDAESAHRIFFRHDGRGNLDPVPFVAFGNSDLADRRVATVRAADKDFGNALEPEAFHPHGEVVRLLVVDGHTVHIVPAVGVVPGIFEMIDPADIQNEIGGIVGVHAADFGDISRTGAVNIPIEPVRAAAIHPALSIVIVVGEVLKFKRIVNDHFGVESAVCRLVNVFKKETVKLFGNLHSPLLCIQREMYHMYS